VLGQRVAAVAGRGLPADRDDAAGDTASGRGGRAVVVRGRVAYSPSVAWTRPDAAASFSAS
jgi:hypothetical protein